MIRIDIKPFSVNSAWKGVRYRTDEYKEFKKLLTLKLKKVKIPEGDLQIYLRFGVSTRNADWDNPIKTFQDILCDKNGINDNRIYKGTVEKVIVKKGEEFIEYKIESYG